MKYSRLPIILAAVMLAALSAYAQEEVPVIEGPDPAHREVNYNEDKTLILDQPVQQNQHPGMRDSVQTIVPKPATRIVRPETPREGQKKGTEDDALRFNFLYYIIQKYKLSDIIEHN